jgi:multidrug efflux pump subunit AcrA (membrane-fusion protein)
MAVAVVAVVGIAALALLCVPVPAQAPAGKGPPGKGGFAMPAPKVLVTAARLDTIAEPRTFVGTVQPIRRSLIGSAVPGRVEEYLIEEGQAVKAGQPIAHLRRGIIQAELNAAKGQLSVRQAELAEMEKSYQEEMEQAIARLTFAQALLSYRQAKLERTRALGSSVSRELLEEDSSTASQAAASVREAQAAYRMFTGGVRQMKTEQARAWVEAQSAEVQRLEEQFDRHTMKAPFDGFVSAEHTEIGQWVMQGDPVAEIVELDQVDVEINVVEDFIGNLTTSVQGSVEVPALPDQRFTGQVAIINPQADARAHTFPVKVRIENQIQEGQPLLKAGMFARVTLAVGKPTEYVLVPKDAVVLGGASPMVYVAVTADGKMSVRPVPVKKGPDHGQWTAVMGGIQEGDQVIVEGNERVRPGQEIRVEAKEVEYP